ncbi:MAG: beta-hydroxyacyl-ACP dehydratase, partial [Rubrivivax sp.]|nr:beta-hydroxyacyl-ACP dehydratase [Rubrivivax sp.]
VEVIGPQLAQPVPLQDQLALLDGGRFRLLGRAADLINVGGKRASLADLNRRLLEVDGVEDAVVFVPDDGQRPAALVVSGLSERQISEQLARRIDPVLLPRPLRIVAQIPRNETGKVARADLLQALRRTGG